MICPHCQSNTLRKIKVRGGVPPRPPANLFSTIFRWCACAFITLVITMFIAEVMGQKYFGRIFIGVGIVFGILTLLLGVKEAKYTASYPRLLEEFNSTWHCLSCGEYSRT